MGIYDREYYRDETSGSGWLSGAAPACKAIILINVGVFLAQWVLKDENFTQYFVAESRPIFERFQVWRLLTAAFLHSPAGPFHILWNMVFLWIVGRDMEAMYGSREFSLMYVSAAVVSSLCWALLDYFGPAKPFTAQMLGASGAVTAVVMLYTLYYPHREVLLMFILPVQMWLLLVVFLGFDFLMLMRELGGGGGASGITAFAAHLGGALYGYVYKSADLRWSRLFAQRRRRPRMRVVSPPEPRDRVPAPPAGSARSAASGGPPRHAPALYFPEEQFDAKLDEILAKIAREGRAGLTEDENRLLEEASRRARDRRSDRV